MSERHHTCNVLLEVGTLGGSLSSGKKPLKWELDDSYAGISSDKTAAGGGVE